MNYFMLTIAILELALFAWAFRCWLKNRENIALLMVTIMLSLQWADAFIVATGSWIGQGDLLEGLNRLRTTWFFLTSPLLLIASLLVLRNARFAWLQSNVLLGGVLLASVVYMGVDGYAAWNASYYPACAADTLRYVMKVAPEQVCPGHELVAVDGYFSPMLIASTAAVVVAGAMLWIRRSWPWLGAVSLLFIAGFVLMPTDVVGPFLSFPLDGLMAATIVLTTIRFAPPAVRSEIRQN
jgi:hypothetical protein